MTTTDAAAVRHVRTCLALAGLTALLGVGLGGCGTSNFNLFGSGDSVAPDAQQSAQAAPVNQTKIAIAPVIGAPDAVSKQLTAQLTAAIEKQRITVAKSPADKVDYTLRGYMVAAKERNGVKLSYIWDLTDGASKRVNRIQKEEVVPGGDSRDPWASVTPQVVQTIADKTAESLSTALAGLTPASAGANTPSGVGAPSQQIASAASAATTGSIPRKLEAAANVTRVIGAPGDGNDSLAAAMRQELSKLNLPAPGPGRATYLVAGKVALAPPKDGKQNIKIDWHVCDPANMFVATVHQSNDITAGALDNAWGQTATLAAQAAAAKINDVIEQDRKGLSGSKQKSCSTVQGASDAVKQAKSN
ncbi:MAG TPA: hypothetical protein VNK52_02720 [Hyphomicrobiaceae bacterium]|nr:hypothetical protein [Hyphomicrobiaceae bacterium]